MFRLPHHPSYMKSCHLSMKIALFKKKVNANIYSDEINVGWYFFRDAWKFNAILIRMLEKCEKRAFVMWHGIFRLHFWTFFNFCSIIENFYIYRQTHVYLLFASTDGWQSLLFIIISSAPIAFFWLKWFIHHTICFT